jgi:hypothetical protein
MSGLLAVAIGTVAGILIYNKVTAIKVTNITLILVRTISDPRGAGWGIKHDGFGAVAASGLSRAWMRRAGTGALWS